MMQFYKKRDFGTLVSDTFTFFKENGKNYFKNYILINGLLLILLVVLFVIGYRELFSQFFAGNVGGQSYYFESYFQENQVMLAVVTLFVFFIFLAAIVINYSYPVFYMKRLSETGNKHIKTDEILSDVKQNFGRVLKLFLGLFFIVTPLAFLVVGLSYLLIIILIGIFVLLLVVPAVMNVVNFLLFDYLHTKKGFFESLSYALRSQFSYPNGNQKSPFWKYWGSVIVVYIIIQVVTSVFTMIPMMLVLASTFTTDSTSAHENPFDGTTGILFFVFYGIGILASFILSNMVYVNAGLMYYDSRTDLHRKEDLSEIDTIGNGF
ncbi:MAG: DUF4013 domain-containing protein [Cruoricaptor ignavus]|nr:DUF4013 domain-containing protein [Cruoricaptor ignavus]